MPWPGWHGKMYLPGQGLSWIFFHHDLEARTFALGKQGQPYPGRPLIDDGVFLKGYRLTGGMRDGEIFSTR